MDAASLLEVSKKAANAAGSNSCQQKEEASIRPEPSVAYPDAETCSKNSPYAELVGEINAMRKKIEQSLKGQELGASSSLSDRVKHLEEENAKLWQDVNNLKKVFEELKKEFSVLRTGKTDAAEAVPSAAKQSEVDEDIDLFGSEEESEDEEKERIRKERLMAYEAKKSKKPVAAAKSSVILDVKPWDDETDMKEMESRVRSIEMDGLVWGASKLVPVGYGIKKLQIMCVVEDEKVSVEALNEQIEAFEDFVQSVDIAAFNKI